MSVNFNNPDLKNFITSAQYGIEKESLRVTSDGYLAHTKHPFPETHPNIDRDFCENQVEIISDVFKSADALLAQLNSIHDEIHAELAKNNEVLWAFSNPPRVKGEDDIPVANFSENRKRSEHYRNYLAKKYGKMKMLFSGIHYNFSFSDGFLKSAFSESGCGDFGEFKNSVYLELAEKLTANSWLIVYLLSASPLMDESFIKYSGLEKSYAYKFSSVRCSEVGYWNDFIPTFDYSSIAAYADSISRYISEGKLRSVSELYYPIRLKPFGENNLENLHDNGVNHIELRMLDVNPFSRVGIIKEDIEFIHALILYLLSTPREAFKAPNQIEAIKNMKSAALYDDKTTFINAQPLCDAAMSVLKQVEYFTRKYAPEFSCAVDLQKQKILDETKRYAAAVREQFGSDFVRDGLVISNKYSKEERDGV